MRIRRLQRKDIKKCLDIIVKTKAASIGGKSEARWFLYYSLIPKQTPLKPDYYIVEERGEVIGVSGLYHDYEDPPHVKWMDYLAIEPKFQKRGYGTLLLEDLEKKCKKAKVKLLCVYVDNYKIPNFYKKKGFKMMGCIDNYYSKGKPRCWLCKNL